MLAEPPTTGLMVLLFTDVVDSVALKQRLTTTVYMGLLQRHDQLLRDVLSTVPSGELENDLGDGYLMSFTSVTDAIHFALRFQHALQTEEWQSEPLHVRIGLHLGEASRLPPSGGGQGKLVGLSVDIAARATSLAGGRQILMTRAAFDEGRQFVSDRSAAVPELVPPGLLWLAHGRYLFKGCDEPMEVFEVGVKKISVLRVPGDSEKARRAVPADEENTLGWRPAVGLAIPARRGWRLESKLGAGGFGEVWLAWQERTKERRVFKFCFDSDRLRSFKRELTMFRLLREALGEREDFARIYEVQVEAPPFYIESEYLPAGSFAQWAEEQGGIGNVDRRIRLELLARAAHAVAAAHSLGIIHKDIKPSNILIATAADGTPRPRLADFGIGILSDTSG